jgi:signal transduction histidine kinase
MSPDFTNDYLQFFKGNKWGSHICHFYNKQEELLEVMVPYFVQGIRDNEACIWAVSDPLTLNEARQIIASAYPGLEDAIDRGQFEFVSYKDIYLDNTGEVKDTSLILNNWAEKENNALRLGFNGIRVSGTVNFLKNRSQWGSFVDYECFVCENMGPHKIKGLCSYPINGNHDLLHVADVVLNHQAILAKRNGVWTFSENPQNKITRQLKEQEEKLMKMAQELSRSNAELARFAYVASHDLKEPIRMVTCFTDLLEKKYKNLLDEDGLKYLNFSNTGAKRAYDLINNLLDYTHLDRKQPELKTVDCNKILETAIENLRLQVEENNAKISSDLLPEIQGNGILLVQLFQNLLSNAIKFRNGTDPEIKISTTINENNIIISFKDNGLGVEKDFLPELFTPFKKYHNKSEIKGDGIGLAICKKIVDKHNGEIWVETTLNEGSEFFVKFPANKKIIQKNKWQNILNDPSEKSHIVQIYSDKNDLAETVSYFTAQGLNNNEAVLLVCRSEHHDLFTQQIQKKYIDTEDLAMAGQLVIISAETAKTSIISDNKPVYEYFERSIGKIVQAMVKKYKKLRIYGEIVDILAEEGNMMAAVELENYWNRLLKKHDFCLFCAYHQKNVKNSPEREFHISTLCTQHTHVIPRSLEFIIND